MVLLGITGRKYNGKDTAAEYLVKKYGYMQLTMAEPLKEMCKIAFGFNQRQLHGDLKETIDSNWGISPRNALQFLGTDIFRNQIHKLIPNIDDKFWIKCMVTRINKLKEENPNIRIVISDIRFPNEISMISGLEGTLMRVVRPSINNDDCHESEKLISSLNVSYEIFNESTLDDLYTKIDVVMSLLGISASENYLQK
jgi:hypothetical protein